jgi:hypothetical protein
MLRCPGQDPRFWKLGDIFDVVCPHCGTAIEFWKDEPSVKCPQCRKVTVNPKLDLGCAQWCQHAEQCLAPLMDPQNILCKKLIREMKSFFGRNEERIDHTLAVFKNAQQILTCEEGDARAVNAAAILHTVCGSCPGRDGPPTTAEPPTVQDILSRCGAEAELVEQVRKLIAAAGSEKDEDSIESKILWDAEWLTTLRRRSADADPAEGKELIERTFKTRKGRELAANHILLPRDG